MKEYSFFAMLSRMKYITRWGLMRNSRQETLSEHTLDVAYIAHALALLSGLDPAKAVLSALYHDCSEILTGDMPTPIKYYNPAIRDAYKDVEALAERKLTEMLPPALQEDYRSILTIQDPEVAALVKAADKLSAYIKCLEELKAGNNEFREAAAQTRQALEGYGLPEVDYFLKTFLESFSLSLDELK